MIRRANGAAVCADCDVAFHRKCAQASAPASYRETHDSAGTRCPRCGDDAVARAAEREASEEAEVKRRLTGGRRTWLVGAAVGSCSHLVVALTVLAAYLAQESRVSLRALLVWIFACAIWWIPRATPVATGLLGGVGLVLSVLGAIGAGRELVAIDAETRVLVLVGYGVVMLASASMALAGLRLATSAAAREYAQLLHQHIERRVR